MAGRWAAPDDHRRLAGGGCAWTGLCSRSRHQAVAEAARWVVVHAVRRKTSTARLRPEDIVDNYTAGGGRRGAFASCARAGARRVSVSDRAVFEIERCYRSRNFLKNRCRSRTHRCQHPYPCPCLHLILYFGKHVELTKTYLCPTYSRQTTMTL